MKILKNPAYYTKPEISDFFDLLNYSWKEHGTKVAYRFKKTPGGEVFEKTFNDFYSEVKQLSFALKSYIDEWQKVERKEAPLTNLLLDIPKIAIIGDNSYDWRLAYFSSTMNETLTVPIDRLLKYHELYQLFKRAKPTILFYTGAYHDRAEQLLRECDSLKLIICLNKEHLKKRYIDEPFYQHDTFFNEYINNEIDFVNNKKMITLEEFMKWGSTLSLNEATAWEKHQNFRRNKKDPALLLFTSGTTEMAKGIVLSQENICEDMSSLAQVIKFPSNLSTISILPLHHTFENTCGFLMMLYLGATVSDIDGLRYIADNLKEYRPNIIIAVPLMFEHFYNKILSSVRKQNKEKKLLRGISLSQTARKFGVDLRRRFFAPIIEQFGGNLRYGIVGAAPCRTELLKFFDAIGIRILEGYGLTETSPVVAGCNTRLFEPGTVGHALPGITLAVDSATDDAGEILIKGKNVMLGYFKEDGTLDRSSIDEDGWFHTGDLGIIDKNTECLRITGRIKSMIALENGKKVFPEEMENVLKSSALIKEVMVFTEKTLTGTIQICASLTLDIESIKNEFSGNLPSQSEIEQELASLITNFNKTLPDYKNIRYYFYSIDEMIKTTTLKIKRPLEQQALLEAFAEANTDVKKIHGKYFSREGRPSPFAS